MKRVATVILCLSVCLTIGLAATTAWAKPTGKVQPVARLSHSGDIAGFVVTCDPEEVVPGALVHIPGLSIMAKTNAMGGFRLLNVPAGVYELAIEIPGRPPFVLEDVVVEKKQLTNLETVRVCHACADNEDCPADAFCTKEPGHCDAGGICEPRPEICPDVWDPVCGCDGATYGNACEAAAAGVNIAYHGECAVGCMENADCLEEAYCAKAVGDCEGEGICEPRPIGCPDVWDPVCGCDGATYGNACEAAAVGVSVDSEGECPEPL